MSKKLQLQIPEPCHENWDKMTPVEKGKFCSSCQKQVIDFSRMSDREIALFFKKPSTGSVCGRFMTDQLNRDLEIPRKRIPWVKYFFQFLLPGFLISMRATAQGQVKTIKKEQVNKECSLSQKENLQPVTTAIGDTLVNPVVQKKCFTPQDQRITFGMIAVRRITKLIVGKISNEQGDAIPYANVSINGTNVMADSLGDYISKIPVVKNKITIKVSAAGYFSNEIDVEATKDVVKQDIVLKADDLMSEVIITTPVNCRRVVGAVSMVRYVVDKGEDQNKSKITPSNEMKLYPNPIRSNSVLHIGWEQNETGDYDLQIFNVAGQLVFKKGLYIDEEARVLSIGLPSLVSGNYFIKMTNRSTHKSYSSKIIVE